MTSNQDVVLGLIVLTVNNTFMVDRFLTDLQTNVWTIHHFTNSVLLTTVSWLAALFGLCFNDNMFMTVF